MSAARLVAIVLLMQARGRVSSKWLAEELEVSVATIRRDLDRLSQAGVPVYAQPGRGGGWQLAGGGRTDLTGLTEDEAIALFWPGEEVKISESARRKVLQALPEPFRKSAVAAHESLFIDSSKWGKRSPTACPPALGDVREALLRRRRLVIDYASRGQSPRQREIDPHRGHRQVRHLVPASAV